MLLNTPEKAALSSPQEFFNLQTPDRVVPSCAVPEVLINWEG